MLMLQFTSSKLDFASWRSRNVMRAVPNCERGVVSRVSFISMGPLGTGISETL